MEPDILQMYFENMDVSLHSNIGTFTRCKIIFVFFNLGKKKLTEQLVTQSVSESGM
jgi:hypothetical protein